jgi:predicted ATPase
MQHLRLKNFKCFDDQIIPIADLTVFCGRNGTGKSSAVQGILLHEAARECGRRGVRELSLNTVQGLALGTLNDVLPRSTAASSKKTDKILIEFGTSSTKDAVEFDTADIPEDANFVRIGKSVGRREQYDPWRFVFLSAERIGPRASQERLSNATETELRLGEHAEHLAEVLARFERRRIRKPLVHPTERSKGKLANELLSRNVELWMSDVFGSLQIRSVLNGPYAPPSLLIRDSKGDTDWVIPTNYGFGVTYCLPVVVGCLLLPKNGTIVIDSPEAHLHPAAQTHIGKFLAWVAASGARVIVETHSDHVVDGMRLGIAQQDWPIEHDACLFIDFEKDTQGAIHVQPIRAREDGSLDRWPQGFFDQQTANLRALANFRHAKRT